MSFENEIIKLNLIRSKIGGADHFNQLSGCYCLDSRFTKALLSISRHVKVKILQVVILKGERFKGLCLHQIASWAFKKRLMFANEEILSLIASSYSNKIGCESLIVLTRTRFSSFYKIHELDFKANATPGKPLITTYELSPNFNCWEKGDGFVFVIKSNSLV